MQPNVTMRRALQRQLRRAQLWHASRLAVPDHETWKAAWPAIGAAIDAQLASEFGPRPT